MGLSRRWARFLYIASYVALIFGIGLCILITGYDLVQQTLALAVGGGKYFYIFILMGSYVATGLFSGIIALARLLTVRKALSDIPKRYMPIKKIDVPKPVHKLISTELTRSAIIRHSTLPVPSHRGLSPPTQPHYPSTSYTPIILHSAILIMSKASRFRRTLLRRKQETLRQYIYRARAEGLWPNEVAREGLIVWLNTYESVRFGGKELSEGEFLDTMKLVYYLLMEMKPPEQFANEYAVHSSSEGSDSSSSFSMDSVSVGSLEDVETSAFLEPVSTSGGDARVVLREMQSLLEPSVGRKSGEGASLGRGSVIDHGSDLEEEIDLEERNRRMRGGRLGQRKGSVIYYDDE